MNEARLPEGLYSIELDMPFNEVIEKVKTALVSGGFNIFAIIDHREAAKSAGMDMPPTSVIIFGSPAGGTGLMKSSTTIAIDLPSRILVSENGKTRLYFNMMDYVKKRHSLSGKDEMVANFDRKVIGILEGIRQNNP